MNSTDKPLKNPYFSHKCAALSRKNAGERVKVAGWVYTQRDHGSMTFIDLIDNTGIVQCIAYAKDEQLYEKCVSLSPESVIIIEGYVEERPEEKENQDIESGEIEIIIAHLEILSEAERLPFRMGQEDISENLKLKYRYLYLRNHEAQEMLRLRHEIIKTLRQEMEQLGFIEVQTPLLTSSTPEGARDFLVASRLHRGKFYALPQAPQQFKQLLMVGRLEKYYQIAPCFRDEDARADRTPGSFYQLDLEIAFGTQEEVFQTMEKVMYNTFRAFAGPLDVSNPPFKRLTYAQSMSWYATDKPDLRNPLKFTDITHLLEENTPNIFKKIIDNQGMIWLLPVQNLETMPRSFFDKMNDFAQSINSQGLGYFFMSEDGSWKGSLAKLMPNSVKELGSGGFVIGHEDKEEFYRIASAIRLKLGEELELMKEDAYKFCWIVDFPMYELNAGQWDFFHNPFSMPQGEMEALNTKSPSDILAWQYDLVCNGYELASGAVRNYRPEIMYRAFEIAGYTKEHVDNKFGAMINAFRFGAPPHAGIAPGVDRIVMLLSRAENLRQIIAFPPNQQGVDLMMNAPSVPSEAQLKELGIKIIEEQ